MWAKNVPWGFQLILAGLEELLRFKPDELVYIDCSDPGKEDEFYFINTLSYFINTLS